MDRFLITHLESYLSGQLGEPNRRRFEQLLARNEKDRETIENMARQSGLFRVFDLPEHEAPGPAPGFHARVLSRVEEARQPSFWTLFLRPPVIRRAAMVACGWLFAVAAVNFYQASAQPSAHDIAQSVLVRPPESADYCNVRLGCDIELNRSTMLAAVMVSRSAGR